jgi:hypothetical protein
VNYDTQLLPRTEYIPNCFLPRLTPVANGGSFEAASWKNRIVADEEAFERLVDLFKQAHGRTPASDCEAYQWGAKMEDAALTAMGLGAAPASNTTMTFA